MKIYPAAQKAKASAAQEKSPAIARRSSKLILNMTRTFFRARKHFIPTRTLMSNCFCVFLFLFLLTATPSLAEEPLRMVASFSILGNMIQEIGGQDVEVETLVGPDEDAHTYQPSPQDIQKLAKADIIVINGLHFEGWLGRLIDASGSKAELLVASTGIRPRLIQEENDPHHHHKHGDVLADPHAWQDLRNGQLYAQNIAAAIIKARPSLEAKIQRRAVQYIQRLQALDKDLRGAFAAIPADKRKIITSHDAFGYFGQAYDIRFLAPVGINTEAEPTAADIRRLIEQIKKEKIQEVFVENMASPRLIEQLAKDSGARLGGRLYADALSKPDGGAPDYLAMIQHNALKILGAMGGLKANK